MDERVALVEYTVGDTRLETTAQRAYVGKKLLSLSPKGFLILNVLALRLHEQRNPLVSKDELLFNLYGAPEFRPKSNSLEVMLNRVRGELVDAGSQLEIVPVYKKGYELRLKYQ